MLALLTFAAITAATTPPARAESEHPSPRGPVTVGEFRAWLANHPGYHRGGEAVAGLADPRGYLRGWRHGQPVDLQTGLPLEEDAAITRVSAHVAATYCASQEGLARWDAPTAAWADGVDLEIRVDDDNRPLAITRDGTRIPLQGHQALPAIGFRCARAGTAAG